MLLPARRRSRRLVRPAGAALGGVVLSLAFAPLEIWPLAPLGVAVITAALWGRRLRPAFGLGLVAGLGTFLPMLFWIRVVGYDAWVALSLLEAVLFAPLGIAVALVSRLPGWPVWAATVWVAQEAWRDRIPFGGFPWGRLAYSQPESPYTPYAAVGGAPLVTLAVALTGCCLAAAALSLFGPDRPRHARRDWFVPAVGALGAAVAATAAFFVPVPTGGQHDRGPATATVALVQGNVPRPGVHFLGRPEEVLRNHVTATEELAARIASGEFPRPDVVIWPENSSDLDPYTNARAFALIDGAVRSVGVPTLVGAVVDNAEDPETYVDNSGIVWDPQSGPGERYVKQHPVPFGEYVPFRSVLARYIDRLTIVAKDFSQGDHTGVLDVGPVRIGDVICFEIAYDGLVRDTVRSGGRVLVVQTNNATYARTAESEQQLAISQLRAVEHGRAVLIAATSGISAVVAPDGSVVERSAELVPALLVHEVPLRDSRTIADRLQIWPEIALTVVAANAVLVAILAARRARRTGSAA